MASERRPPSEDGAALWRRATADVKPLARREKKTQPAPKTPPSPAAPATKRSAPGAPAVPARSEEHTSELQSLMRTSYAVFCLKNKKNTIRVKVGNSIRTTTIP